MDLLARDSRVELGAEDRKRTRRCAELRHQFTQGFDAHVVLSSRRSPYARHGRRSRRAFEMGCLRTKQRHHLAMDALRMMRVFARRGSARELRGRRRGSAHVARVRDQARAAVEDRLGVRLLDRTTRSVSVTEAGRRLSRALSGVPSSVRRLGGGDGRVDRRAQGVAPRSGSLRPEPPSSARSSRSS